MLLITSVCAAVLISCGVEPVSEPERPPDDEFIAVWHSILEVVDVNVGYVIPEFNRDIIVDECEKVYTHAVTDADNYRMSFRADGTGTGIGTGGRYANIRYKFNFKWQMSDDKLKITLIEDDLGDYLLLLDVYSHCFYNEIVWSVDEYTETRMTLSSEFFIICEGTYGDWSEESTIRYTFEKVE
jgi:hypothetical protein